MTKGIEWDLRGFFREWKRVRGASDRAGANFVRFQAKQLTRALSWFTPIAPFFAKGGPVLARGRARSGWWAAASGLGLTTVYSQYPDKGEGSIQDGSSNILNPRIVLTNAVPYINEIVGHGNWPQTALAQEIVRGQERLEQMYRREFQTWL